MVRAVAVGGPDCAPSTGSDHAHARSIDADASTRSVRVPPDGPRERVGLLDADESAQDLPSTSGPELVEAVRRARRRPGRGRRRPRRTSRRGPGLRGDQPAGGVVPEVHALLDVAVGRAVGDVAQVEGARSQPADVADLRQQPGHAPRPGRRARPALVAEAGDDQPLAERRRPAHADRPPSRWHRPPPSVATYSSPVAALTHHPGDDARRRPRRRSRRRTREAVEEVDGAVDRVDDPAHAAGCRSTSSPSSPRNAVVGPAPPSTRPRISASRPRSACGDDVGRAGLGVATRRRSARARGPAGGLAGDVDGEVAQLGGRAGAVTRGHRRPQSAGASPRGLGQQPAGRGPSGPQRADRGAVDRSSPRSAAARSSSRSRTIATKRGSMPAVAARRAAAELARRSPAPRCRGRRRPPCGRTTKPIGTSTTAGTPSSAQVLEVVVDVGLEPRHLRRRRSASRRRARAGARCPVSCARPARRPRRRR